MKTNRKTNQRKPIVDIQDKVIRPADRDRADSKNDEISYNRLPNRQVMQSNGEYTRAYKTVMKKRNK